jgi:hypothetical protein
MSAQQNLTKTITTINIHQKISTVIYKGVSILFHPLFVPLYITLYAVYVHPQIYVGRNMYDRFALCRIVTVNTLIFPLVTVLIMKGLGFIKTIYLKTGRERMVVLIATMLFYFWMHYIITHTLALSQQSPQPNIMAQYFLGVFLSIPSAFMATNFLRISLHAIAWGNAVAFFVFIGIQYTYFIGIELAIITLLAGLVGTARLQLKDHTHKELYVGFIVGALCQVAAYYIG